MYISNSRDETKKIAAAFAKELKAGDVVCLIGDLGAGKTAFVDGLVNALGFTDYVSSPTFTLINEYTTDPPVYHFDVYRIENAAELYDIGLDEYLFGDGICVIEWADKIIDILPDNRYEVTITKNDKKGDDYREIEIIKRFVPAFDKTYT